MTTDPLNAEALAAAVNRLRENLDSFDREMAFEVETGGERADLWTDIDVGVDDLRTLLDALPSVQTEREVTEAAQFLLDRLAELEIYDADFAREWFGHVDPAIGRLKAALAPPPEVQP